MEFYQSESTKKIAEQTKKDIEILVEAYKFICNDRFSKVNGMSLSRISLYANIDYALWSYYSFKEKEYLDFLKKFTTEELHIGSIVWGDFKYHLENPNYDSIEIIDRIDYAIKFLSKTFDIPIPSLMEIRFKGQNISIKNNSLEKGKLIRELEIFITRVLMLITNIEKFDIGDNYFSQIKNDWIQKLTKNKHDELLSEVLKFYQINKDDDKSFKIILLSQRLNKWKEEKQLSTKDDSQLDLELNKITRAILEIIS